MIERKMPRTTMGPRRFRRDRRAAAQLPMQLIISIIVGALTISIVYQAVDGYRSYSSENEMERQIYSLVEKIEQVRSGANGTSMIHKLDLPQETQYIRIGGNVKDPLDKNLKNITYKLIGKTVGLSRVAINLTGKINNVYGMFSMSGGDHILVFTHIQENGAQGLNYVLVSRY